MAEETNGEESHEGVVDEPHKGISRYAGRGKNESLEDWIAKKEERANRASQGYGGMRSSGTLKKTQLNPVSKKQKKRNDEYKKARESHYSRQENRQCRCCGTTNNLSIHHTEKRGCNTSNEESFITLCIIGDFMDRKFPESNHSHSGGCHGWVEANKSQARELGLMS